MTAHPSTKRPLRGLGRLSRRRQIFMLGLVLVAAAAVAAAAIEQWSLVVAGIAVILLATLYIGLQALVALERVVVHLTAQDRRAEQHLARVERAIARVERASEGLSTRLTSLDQELRHEGAARVSDHGNLVARAEALEGDLGRVLSRQARVDRVVPSLIREQDAAATLRQRFKPKVPISAAGGWALDPSAILALLEVISTRKPSLVVELGGGVSSVWLGYQLQALGHGRVVSVESDEEFADHTRRMLARHELDQVVEVRLARLEGDPLEDHSTAWYSPSQFKDLTDIDVLIVDGPPRRGGPQARYPALPMLRDRLSSGAVIALDDVNRQEERETLERWYSEFELASVDVSLTAPSLALTCLA